MTEVIVAEDAAAGTDPATGEEPFEYEHGEGRPPEEPEAGDGDGAGEAPRMSLADMAAATPDAEAGTEKTDDGDPQPRLFGSESKITAAVKGPKPTTSHIKFKAAAQDITGQFQPDDLLELRVLCQLDKVEIAYRRDKSGAIKSTKRVHYATAITVEQENIPADLRRRRLVTAAEALGVDPDAMAGAIERAAAEVE